jgi:hypothetical protein
METLLETMGYALLFRPVHAIAIGVFAYRAAAALRREVRRARHAKSQSETPAASPVLHRPLAA